MDLKIREANTGDYINICSLVTEVHNLHLNNRPDFFKNVDEPFSKEEFEDLLNE